MQKFSPKLNIAPIKVLNKVNTIPTVKRVDSKTSRVDNDKASWVQYFEYAFGDKTLTVTYRDGFKATYYDIEPELAEDFRKADSKGRWALANLWGRRYS